MPVTVAGLRKLALSLPGVEEGTWYGTLGFRVGKKYFTRLREDGDSLVVPATFEERAEMMEAEPVTYYIADHYREGQYVLVRLSRVSREALRDLLAGAARKAGTNPTKRRVES